MAYQIEDGPAELVYRTAHTTLEALDNIGWIVLDHPDVTKPEHDALRVGDRVSTECEPGAITVLYDSLHPATASSTVSKKAAAVEFSHDGFTIDKAPSEGRRCKTTPGHTFRQDAVCVRCHRLGALHIECCECAYENRPSSAAQEMFHAAQDHELRPVNFVLTGKSHLHGNLAGIGDLSLRMLVSVVGFSAVFSFGYSVVGFMLAWSVDGVCL